MTIYTCLTLALVLFCAVGIAALVKSGLVIVKSSSKGRPTQPARKASPEGESSPICESPEVLHQQGGASDLSQADIQESLAKYGTEISPELRQQIGCSIKTRGQLRSFIADFESNLSTRLEEALEKECRYHTDTGSEWILALLLNTARDRYGLMDISGRVISLAGMLHRSIEEVAATVLYKTQTFRKLHISLERKDSNYTLAIFSGFGTCLAGKRLGQLSLEQDRKWAFWFALGMQIAQEKLALSTNRVYGRTDQCRWVFDGSAADWLMFSKRFEGTAPKPYYSGNDI